MNKFTVAFGLLFVWFCVLAWSFEYHPNTFWIAMIQVALFTILPIAGLFALIYGDAVDE